MRKLVALAASGLLLLALAAPVSAHPTVPAQSLCVVSANAVTGMHTAYGNVGAIPQHILAARAGHQCFGG